jgi:hypothetical protein
LNWKQLPYKVNSHYDTFPSPEKPKHFKKLLKIATKLSRGFITVRVDFYIIKTKIYFGEMTFTSGSGIEDIVPQSFHKQLCSMIKLPKLAYSIDLGEHYLLRNPTKTKFYLLCPYYIGVFLMVSKLLYYLLKKNFSFYFCLIIILIFSFIIVINIAFIFVFIAN